mgnify:CR=1 FL=1
MSTTYLSSRVEVLKALFVETGRKVALINAPVEFKRWIDSGLPEDTEYHESLEDLDDAGSYDIILLWNEEGDGIDVDRCRDRLDSEGDLWTVIPISDTESKEELRKKSDIHKKNPGPVPLTLDLEMVPVILRSGRIID